MLYQSFIESVIWYLIWFLVGFIDFNVIIGQFLGAVLSFAVGIALASYEYNRRKNRAKRNWLKQLHFALTRCRTVSPDILSGMPDKDRYATVQRHSNTTDKIRSLITDSEYDIQVTLLSAIESVVMKAELIEYSWNQDDQENVEEYNKQIRNSALIALYILEQQSDLEYERSVSEERGEEAKKLMKTWLEETQPKDDDRDVEEYIENILDRKI